jgi:exonuclease III
LENDKKDFRKLYNDLKDEQVEDVNLTDSQYYTESEFTNLLQTHNITNERHLTLITLNIANLLSKLSNFKIFLSNISGNQNKPEIISIVETHISENTNSGYDKNELSNILPGYKFFYKGRKVKKGGGVGVFVEEALASEVEVETSACFIEEIFETIILKLPNIIIDENNSKAKDLVLVVIYRQPGNNNTDTFLKEIEKCLKCINKKSNKIIVTGDMNLDLLKHEHHLPTASYLDVMMSHGLLPRIVRPTRIKNSSASLIDHFFTGDDDKTVISGVLATEIAGAHGYTDHYPIFSIIRTKPREKKKEKYITKSYFTQAGNLERRNRLENENWDEVYNESDPNIVYDLIQEKYGKHYHAAKTTKTVKNNKNRCRKEPWMTKDILADMRKRDRLAKIKDRRGDYKSLRNDIVRRVRAAEREDLKFKLQESWNDTKKQWKLLNKAMNKLNNKNDITTSFFHDGVWIEDKQTNAENMNQYLSQVGPTTNESVGKSKYPTEILQSKQRKHTPTRYL